MKTFLTSQTKAGGKFLNVYTSSQRSRILNKKPFELATLVELSDRLEVAVGWYKQWKE